MPHAFRHMPANGCLFSRRRPTRPRPGGRPIAQLPPKPEARAVRSHNWDSNTVLNRTWQIPGSSTSACRRLCRSPKRDENRPARLSSFPPFRHGFLRCPASPVDHGMRTSAMVAGCRREISGDLLVTRRRDETVPQVPTCAKVTNAKTMPQTCAVSFARRYRSRQAAVLVVAVIRIVTGDADDAA